MSTTNYPLLYGLLACFCFSFYFTAIDAHGDTFTQVSAKANQLEQIDDIDNALPLFTEAISQQPRDIESHFKRSLLYFRNGEYAKGKKDVEAMISISPDHYMSQMGKIFLYYYSDNVTSAKKALDGLQINHPNEPMVAFYNALIKMRVGNTDDAKIDLDHAIALNNNYLLAHYYKAMLNTNNKDIFMQEMSISLSLNKKHIPSLREKALYLLDNGLIQNAFDPLNEWRSEDVEGNCALAYAYFKSGNKKDALDSLILCPNKKNKYFMFVKNEILGSIMGPPASKSGELEKKTPPAAPPPTPSHELNPPDKTPKIRIHYKVKTGEE